MEYVFEFLLELVFEIGVEVSKNKRTPKWIRCLLLAVFVLFFLAVIALMLFAGIVMLKENTLAAILFIAVGLFLPVMGIIKFRKAYCKHTHQA